MHTVEEGFHKVLLYMSDSCMLHLLQHPHNAKVTPELTKLCALGYESAYWVILKIFLLSNCLIFEVQKKKNRATVWRGKISNSKDIRGEKN